MTSPHVSQAWRRTARWLAALTLGAALVMFAASGIWAEWVGWLFLLWVLVPAPLVLWLADRFVQAEMPYRIVAVGLGLGALVQLWLALITVEQFLINIVGIRVTNAEAQSLYGLVVLFAPLYVAPAPILGLLAGFVLRFLTPVAGRHSPR